MRGLILKDFYNMLKNIGPTLVTTICVGLLLMVQGNPSLFVIGFAIAGGGVCSTCLRMDETAGCNQLCGWYFNRHTGYFQIYHVCISCI